MPAESLQADWRIAKEVPGHAEWDSSSASLCAALIDVC